MLSSVTLVTFEIAVAFSAAAIWVFDAAEAVIPDRRKIVVKK